MNAYDAELFAAWMLFFLMFFAILAVCMAWHAGFNRGKVIILMNEPPPPPYVEETEEETEDIE